MTGLKEGKGKTVSENGVQETQSALTGQWRIREGWWNSLWYTKSKWALDTQKTASVLQAEILAIKKRQVYHTWGMKRQVTSPYTRIGKRLWGY